MKKNLRPIDLLKNEKGILTVDYLLSFVLIMGFTVILFAISVTLTVVEITQYSTFAAARAFYASHFTIAEQQTLGQQKLNELVSHPVFATFYNNGWFEISNVDVSENAGKQLGYGPGNSAINLFQGARLTLKANMLDFEIPGYGSTASSDLGTDGGFQTNIGSYLSKEPSFGECTGFNKDRWEAIKALGYEPPRTNSNSYLAIHDNGC